MKIEHMEPTKNKLLVDKSAPNLNGMLWSLCQKKKKSHFVWQFEVTILI